MAGSSDELDRVSGMMERLRALGFEITLDWPSIIRGVGNANPRTATRQQRAAWALQDLEGVESSHAVLMLSPERGHARGAFYELAHANACGITTIVAGRTHTCSIFSALATVEVDSDEAGIGILCEMKATRDWCDA